jgi:hypothetical protein
LLQLLMIALLLLLLLTQVLLLLYVLWLLLVLLWLLLLQLVEAGDFPGALLLARSQLTPLADTHSELLPCLKASMALLLPRPAAGGSSGSNGSNGSSAALGQKLWDVLLPLLQSSVGIEPPGLVSLVQVGVREGVGVLGDRVGCGSSMWG